MIFSSWGRLVQIYEKRILKLFSHFKAIHGHEFEIAANAVAKAMAAETANVNASSWRAAAAKSTNARRIYQALRAEIETQNLDPVLRKIANENAALITKLPSDIRREISQRAAELVREGGRPLEIERQLKILRPLLAKSRIKLIARTEISRANTALNQVRSERLGLPAYVWTTAHDERVRKSHRNMNGVIVFWSDPPSPEGLIGEKSTLGRYHGGACPNCRCDCLVLADLNEVKWPHRVFMHGSIKTMSRPAFAKIAGFPLAA